MKNILIICISVVFTCFSLSAQTIQTLTQKENTSFRGLDTYRENVVWVSGSNGTVGRSTDAGKTWAWVSPTGYETFDFRDIEVFGKNEAIILSSGTPSVILRTTNGGKSWREVYRNESPNIFLNGMDFQNKTGFAFGDPIEGNFQLLKSTNKGRTWTDVSEHMFLMADEGEVGFAASGTAIQVLNDNVWVGTGGRYSSLFRRNEKALKMDKTDVPILSGRQSTGIFSIVFWDDATGVVVGGDYMQDQNNENNVLLTFDGGQSWEKPRTPVHGFRSAVAYTNKNTLIATGTSGTDLSVDAGRNWKNISTESFNTIAVSQKGKKIFLAGNDGKVSLLEF